MQVEVERFNVARNPNDHMKSERMKVARTRMNEKTMFEKILISVKQVVAVPNILAGLLALYGVALLTRDVTMLLA